MLALFPEDPVSVPRTHTGLLKTVVTPVLREIRCPLQASMSTALKMVHKDTPRQAYNTRIKCLNSV